MQQRGSTLSTGGGPIDPTLSTPGVLGNVSNRRSLNREARRRELIKITKENQQILKRLQNKSANYNVSKWQKEEESRTRILRNICEYPLLEKTIEN